MSQISTLSTFKLFGRTALRRLINRSAAMKIPNLKKKACNPGVAAAEAPAASDAPVRTATRHRSDRTSLVRRIAGLWLPIASLVGAVGLSFNTMFVIQGAINLEESRTAAVLTMSPESYEKLKKAAATAVSEARTTEIEQALSTGFSSPAVWQSHAFVQLAKERFESQGIAGFTPLKNESRFTGALAYLSPDGRVRAMRAVGFNLAFLSLAMLSVAFGLTSRHLASGDPSLTWLWQFPVPRRVLFTSKLIEYAFDNPIVPMMTLFYSTAVWLCGASFFGGLGIGLLLGFSTGVALAAIRLGAETILTQKVGRRSRGAVVACLAAAGSFAMLVCMMGSNSQFLVESLIKYSNQLPDWCSLNVFSGGIGSDAMMDQRVAWWWIAPVTATVLAVAAVLLAVRLTTGGLACVQDSVRGAGKGAKPHAADKAAGRSRMSTMVWKELMQMRRQPEFAGQVMAAPLGIAFMVYLGGYGNVVEAATHGGTNISIAILVMVAYMLMVAAGQMLTSEFKSLWLLQCQPRPLADVLRSKSRVWAVISMVVSVPFFVAAVVLRPSEAGTVLLQSPFMLVSLWLLAETIFGMTSLAATITNEGTVRFRRTAMFLPLLVIGNLSLAIYQNSVWLQLGALVTLAVFNATVRERQLVELAWLSEPVETPPKRVYPMHAVLALIAFQAILGAVGGGLLQVETLSATARLSISYIVAAAVVAAVFKTWMSENKLVVVPKLPRGPILRPIFYGLAISCVAGAAVTLFLIRFGADSRLPANATSLSLPTALYDKWFLFAMWVVAAPLFEEWLFRGVLYRSLRRNWSMWLSVAVSAVLFATLHPVAGCAAVASLGTMTALTAEKTGRLWPSIVVHAGYNFMIWVLCVM